MLQSNNTIQCYIPDISGKSAGWSVKTKQTFKRFGESISTERKKIAMPMNIGMGEKYLKFRSSVWV